jgi:hypothetical protein
MSDDLTIDDFGELTPEQKAMRAAMAEIKDAAGTLKTKLRNELRTLRRKRSDCLVPTEQASLDEQIAVKQKDFDDVDCLSHAAPSARQDHFKRLIKWDEIMRKHGVNGH